MTSKQIEIHWNDVFEALKKNEELLKDKLWRMEHLYFVTDKKGKKVLFTFNRAQKEYIKNRKHKNIILKSRQLGFTTLITLWNFDNILFHPDSEALAIAHTKDEMAKIFDKKVRYAFNNLHAEIKSFWSTGKNSATKFQVKFSGDSTSGFAVSLSGIGGTFQYVHVSEFAKLFSSFPDRAERVTMETFPAVPFEGFIDIESTAEAAAGPFYKMYVEALKNLKYFNDTVAAVQFYPHFYNWTYDDEELNAIKGPIPVAQMEPSLEIDWKQYQLDHELSDREITYYYLKWIFLGKDKNINDLHSQYPTTWEEAFIASGTPYFNARRVSELMLKTIEPTGYDISGDRVEEAYGGPLMVVRKPDPKAQYVIGGDTAEGLSTGDSSTLAVINVTTREIDAIFKNTVEPYEFASICVAVAKWYNGALLAIEVNKDGLWVNDQIQRLGYSNIYFREVTDDITKTINKYFGWRTDKKTRDTMLTELKAQFIKHDVKFAVLLGEMLTFIRNKRGKPEAVSGEHDDVIMAAAIGYEVLKQRYREELAAQTPGQSTGEYMSMIFGK